MNNFKKAWPYLLIVVLITTTTTALIWGMNQKKRADSQSTAGNDTNETLSAQERLEGHGITPLTSAEASNSQTTAEDLAYILEEEKLAHDAYHVLGEKWNVRAFDNIKKSELTHQSLVWAVMESRGLPDSRTKEIGKFNNQELQKLYDQLIAQGRQSRTEAIKVGIAIEETDIADLKRIIDNLDPKDEDVKAVLENLLRGSENHLSAFQRQLSRQ